MARQARQTIEALSSRVSTAMTQRTPVSMEALMDFRGGVSLLDPFSVAPNQLRRADNVILSRDGRLKRRSGYTQWGTNFFGTAVTSLAQFNRADGTTFFLMSNANGSTYRDGGVGGPWVGLAGGMATGADTHPLWRTYANLAIMAGPGNAPQKYDGTIWGTLLGVNADTSPASVIETHHGRLWLGKGSRVRFSDTSNAESFPTNNFLDISINDGEDLQAALRVQNQLFFAKRTSLFALLGDSPLTYGWVSRTRPGVIAPNSVQIIDNLAYFLSDDGLYLFDGVRARKVSWALDPLFEQASPGVNLSRLQYAQSVYYPILHQYWLLVSSPGVSTLDTVYVGHVGFLHQDETGRVHLPFTKFPLAMNALGLIQQAGVFRLVSGDGAGYVYRQDDGLTDNGAAIAWAVETQDLLFTDADHLKLPQYADLILDKVLGGSMTVTLLFDFGLSQSNAVTVTLDGSSNPHYQTISVPGQAQAMRFLLNGTTAMGLRGLITSARVSKGRR